jgi:hypothetical protein
MKRLSLKGLPKLSPLKALGYLLSLGTYTTYIKKGGSNLRHIPWLTPPRPEGHQGH